jgi:integrase
MASIQKRVSPNGKISFRVQVRKKGYPPARATFERLTDAKRWATNTEAEMQENRYFKNTASKKKTVSELIDRYLSKIQKDNPKRFPEVKQMLEWWREEIGVYMLADLSKALISEKIGDLSKRKKTRFKEEEKASRVNTTISPARVNRYVSALSHCISLAVNELEWLQENPLRKISKLKEPRGRIRFLSDTERSKLLEACLASDYKPLYLIVILAISTGARRGEILNLRWPDLDFKRGQIIVHETKNGERRILPLAGKAMELMQAHYKSRSEHTELIFPYGFSDKPQDIRAYFENALVRAEISNFRFHDLRHTAASYLAMNGASLAEIAEVLGHKTLSMVKRYAHLTEAHTKAVVTRMNERVFGHE